MSKKRQVKDRADKGNVDDEKSESPNDAQPAQTFDEYQCTGNVEADFTALCAFLDLLSIPAVSTKQSASFTSGSSKKGSRSQINAASLKFKKRLQVELENDDPLSAKSIRISGWTVDEDVAKVLQKMLPSLKQLECLQFWKAGLTDSFVTSLTDTLPLCSNLRVLKLDGNPLREQNYHCLLSETSLLSHLSLRNNRIGDSAARLIGSALSTSTCSNKNLLSLNLAFNSIGDEGAAHIAQGLRLNRALLFLSLSNNQIGDSGAAQLATILGEFALTHEEVVERRRLLLESTDCSSPGTPDQLTSGTSSKGEKKGSSKKKETTKSDEQSSKKSNKKSSDGKGSQSRGGKSGDKDKQTEEEDSSAHSEVESEEIGNPLLDPVVQHKDGELYLPGNTTLLSLNLAGNRITEKSLPLFLTSLEMQGEGEGLLRLCLQRNLFPPECESSVRINKMMALRYQRSKSFKDTEEEHGATPTHSD